MAALRTLWQNSVDLLTAHPRFGLAVRTAVAAALAWFVVALIPGAVDYAYYAPLGAVAATSVSVVGTLQHTARAGVAVVLGAVIGLAARELLPSGVWSVAAVVCVGVLVAGIPLLGDLGAWVPTAALFVLVLGGQDPVGYPAIYAGLVLLGGVIGTLVSLLFPQMPLTPIERSLTRLRTAMVEDLEHLATGLEHDEPPDGAAWGRRIIPLNYWIWSTHRARQAAEESRRWNLRANRWHARRARLTRQARGFEHAAWLVQDLGEIISGEERSDKPALGLGQGLRPQAASVLHAVAAAMNSLQEDGVDRDQLAEAWQSLDAFADRVGEERTPSPDGFHMASNVVNSLRRVLLLLADLAPASADRAA